MFNRLILTVFLLAGCDDRPAAAVDAGGDLTTAPGADLAMAPRDMTPNNPPNPAGLGPKPVDVGTTSNLGEAGSYVLLAKTGITNVTGSMITGGHVGVSPEVAASITGFGEAKDLTGIYATSASVMAPWKIYASDYTIPTPTYLTSAVLSMEGAYTDAAGRSPPDHLNLASGNLAGLTLAPGLYTWGNTVTIPGDFFIAGAANDVWIFQISNDLDVSTDKKVTLTGGAQAKNVYWQVAGQVTLHAGAHLEGIILSKTGITLQNKATLKGRALAQSLIALDDNAIEAP
jgi:hypothetical protein